MKKIVYAVFFLTLSLFAQNGVEKSKINTEEILNIIEEESIKGNQAPKRTETKQQKLSRESREIKEELSNKLQRASIGLYDKENIDFRIDFLFKHLNKLAVREKKKLYKRFFYPEFMYKKIQGKEEAIISSSLLNKEVERINQSYEEYAELLDASHEVKILKKILPISLRLKRLEVLEDRYLASSKINRNNTNRHFQSSLNNDEYDYVLQKDLFLAEGVKVTKINKKFIEIRREY